MSTVTKADPETGSDTAAPTVRIRGLRKAFRVRRRSTNAVWAVDGVDLDVHPGQIVVLLGPSGCGKTTLLRTVAGFEQPDAGSIEIGGRSVYDSSDGIFVAAEHRGVGMMFQSYALWPHMTVYNNIAYPLTARSSHIPRHEVPGRVRTVLQMMGLEGVERRYPGELSGGQQQRIALARALVTQSQVLLFDEPLSNVDAKVRKRLRMELREIQRAAGFAAIYVTHDQEEAMELADVLVVMRDGRIEQQGTPAEVYNSPATMSVAEFVGEINRLPGKVTRAGADGFTVDTVLGALPFPARDDVAVGEQGTLALRPEDIRVKTAAQPGELRATVEDVVFLGSRTETQLRFETADGSHRMTAWSARDEMNTALVVGSEVAVSFHYGPRQWLREAAADPSN